MTANWNGKLQRAWRLGKKFTIRCKRKYIKLKRGIWTVSQKYKEEIGPRAMAVKSFGSELAAQCIGHGNQYPDQQQSLNICIARALYTYNTDSAVTLAWLPTRYYTSARLYIYFLFFLVFLCVNCNLSLSDAGR